MEVARHIGRRIDHRPRLRARPFGVEQAVRFPMGVPAGFEFGGVEGLGELGHGAGALALDGPETPPRDLNASRLRRRVGTLNVTSECAAGFKDRLTAERSGEGHAINCFSCAALLAIALAACSGGNSGSDNASPPVSMAPGSSIEKAPAATIGMTVSGETCQKARAISIASTTPQSCAIWSRVRLENKSATLRPEIKIYNAHRAELFDKYDGTAGASVEQRSASIPARPSMSR